MMNTLYIRGLRRVKHTVFCVDDGQKQYYDPVSSTYVPYSSGQQVKRSIMDYMVRRMGQHRAPMTFRVREEKDAIKAAEVFSDCDPRYPDLLIGGWMRSVKGEPTLKRRSPLSISALTPLHPQLAAINKEVVVLDRRDDPEDRHHIEVTDGSGNVVDVDIEAFFADKERSSTRLQFTDRNKNGRATGLFEYTVAIDLDRLFSVPKRSFDTELKDELHEALRESEWPEDDQFFYAPADERSRIADCLSEAVLRWRVTSNQQRTFDLQQNLVTVVSRDPYKIGEAIFASHGDDGHVEPILDPREDVLMHVANQARSVFVSPPAGGSLDEIQSRIKAEIMETSVSLPGRRPSEVQ